MSGAADTPLRVVHPWPAGTHEVAWREDPGISEAIGLAPEQVWPLEHGMRGQSVDKGDRTGTRQELRV